MTAAVDGRIRWKAEIRAKFPHILTGLFLQRRRRGAKF